MASLWGRVTGELSKLRGGFYNMLGWSIAGSWNRPYHVDSTRVDYHVARALYENTHEDYKLGAGFAKPVVNTAASFMGVPSFRSSDEDAEEVLEQFTDQYKTKMMQTELNALKDGDAFVWITRERKQNPLYPEERTSLIYNMIPPDMVKDIILDPVTSRPVEYILESEHAWKDETLQERRYRMTQRIRAGEKEVLIDGDAPDDVEEGIIPTPWDFIPIVHFKNEATEHDKFGKSELEVIEPYMKSYHDVALHAISGSKMHSTPKLKLQVKDVRAFLRNNFGVEDPARFAKEGGSIDLNGRDVLFLGPEDDAGFLEVSSATGDAKMLLQLLFYCIVDASETPEFVFGVHTPSSLSSVKEQMPIMVRKVNRKRDQYTGAWQHVARIVLAMTAISENKTFATYATSLNWPEVDPRDSKEIADEIQVMVNALVQGVQGQLISIDAAVDKLSEYIDTMEKYEGDEESETTERDRLMRTRLALQGLEDTQLLQQQREAIEQLTGGRNE